MTPTAASEHWIEPALDGLARQPRCGYWARGTVCAEPTALAAIALCMHERYVPARDAADQLAEMQDADGGVGVSVGQSTPVWPTGLAVIAWQTSGGDAADGIGSNPFRANIDRALAKMLTVKGEALNESQNLGHNVMLQAWPWVEGTHSWIEPTAIQLLALKLSGLGEHPRAREAVELIVDRLLPEGGCNYGNTTVLGNTLRPHMQPTGMALQALAGESDRSGRITKSLEYLRRELSPRTTALSLSHALLGLAAHDVELRADHWLEVAYRRNVAQGESPYKSAMLLLAAARGRCPLARDTPREAAL
jgi:hypothetical protein